MPKTSCKHEDTDCINIQITRAWIIVCLPTPVYRRSPVSFNSSDQGKGKTEILYIADGNSKKLQCFKVTNRIHHKLMFVVPIPSLVLACWASFWIIVETPTKLVPQSLNIELYTTRLATNSWNAARSKIWDQFQMYGLHSSTHKYS